VPFFILIPKKSKTAPPFIHEMKAFEDDLVNMMENIQFRNVSDKLFVRNEMSSSPCP
jgi:hypothetical protein